MCTSIFYYIDGRSFMKQCYSGIGGQAVMEGVMMRNRRQYAVAVRLPDGDIHVDVKEDAFDLEKFQKIPIVRGVVSFFHSLIIGMGTLMYSASFFEEEDAADAKSPDLSAAEKRKNERKEKAEMGGTLVLSFVLALGLFLVFPFYLAKWLSGTVLGSPNLLALIEGAVRVALFLGYVALISKMEDIRRVFMYHGAEHKCINCIEHGLPLTVENVRQSSRQHKRCGTSFVFFVFIIAIFVFLFIRTDSPVSQLALRLLLVPVIAGLSYEVIRLAGRVDNAFVNVLSKPGLWVQNLTTREPDDKMIEVGISSVEAVFDWRAFEETHRADFGGGL